MTYAENTTVSIDRSLDEIRKTLKRYGATSFMFAEGEGKVALLFEMNDRRVQFVVTLPEREDREFTHTPGRGQRRSRDAADKAYDQAVRQRFRALLLVVKAKLESVSSSIETFEEAFLAQIVLPGNMTVGKWLIPQIETAYLDQRMPPLLPAGREN